MAQLIVRNLDEAVVRALKKRAARNNRSIELEHRQILKQALLQPRRRSLAQVLAAMPDTSAPTRLRTGFTLMKSACEDDGRRARYRKK